MKRTAALLVAAAMLLATATFAQNGLRQVPLGFCSLSGMSSATPLSICAGGIPAGTTYAVICAYTQGVVWRDDGTAPTGTQGTGGQGLVPSSSTVPTCIPYNGNFIQFQAIQQTGGAILGVTFYK